MAKHLALSAREKRTLKTTRNPELKWKLSTRDYLSKLPGKWPSTVGQANRLYSLAHIMGDWFAYRAGTRLIPTFQKVNSEVNLARGIISIIAHFKEPLERGEIEIEDYGFNAFELVPGLLSIRGGVVGADDDEDEIVWTSLSYLTKPINALPNALMNLSRWSNKIIDSKALYTRMVVVGIQWFPIAP